MATNNEQGFWEYFNESLRSIGLTPPSTVVSELQKATGAIAALLGVYNVHLALGKPTLIQIFRELMLKNPQAFATICRMWPVAGNALAGINVPGALSEARLLSALGAGQAAVTTAGSFAAYYFGGLAGALVYAALRSANIELFGELMPMEGVYAHEEARRQQYMKIVRKQFPGGAIPHNQLGKIVAAIDEQLRRDFEAQIRANAQWKPGYRN